MGKTEPSEYLASLGITPQMIEAAASVIRSRCGDDYATHDWATDIAQDVLAAALERTPKAVGDARRIVESLPNTMGVYRHGPTEFDDATQTNKAPMVHIGTTDMISLADMRNRMAILLWSLGQGESEDQALCRAFPDIVEDRKRSEAP